MQEGRGRGAQDVMGFHFRTAVFLGLHESSEGATILSGFGKYLRTRECTSMLHLNSQSHLITIVRDDFSSFWQLDSPSPAPMCFRYHSIPNHLTNLRNFKTALRLVLG